MVLLKRYLLAINVVPLPSHTLFPSVFRVIHISYILHYSHTVYVLFLFHLLQSQSFGNSTSLSSIKHACDTLGHDVVRKLGPCLDDTAKRDAVSLLLTCSFAYAKRGVSLQRALTAQRRSAPNDTGGARAHANGHARAASSMTVSPGGDMTPDQTPRASNDPLLGTRADNLFLTCPTSAPTSRTPSPSATFSQGSCVNGQVVIDALDRLSDNAIGCVPNPHTPCPTDG